MSVTTINMQDKLLKFRNKIRKEFYFDTTSYLIILLITSLIIVSSAFILQVLPSVTLFYVTFLMQVGTIIGLIMVIREIRRI